MSYVAILINDTKTITNPTWTDVGHEIRALDACTHSIVMLAPMPPEGAPEGDHHMAIGGGAQSRYIVHMTENNLIFSNLIDPSNCNLGTDRKVRMLIGGQEGEYWEGQFVSYELALRAARQYFENGRHASGLMWSEG